VLRIEIDIKSVEDLQSLTSILNLLRTLDASAAKLEPDTLASVPYDDPSTPYIGPEEALAEATGGPVPVEPPVEPPAPLTPPTDVEAPKETPKKKKGNGASKAAEAPIAVAPEPEPAEAIAQQRDELLELVKRVWKTTNENRMTIQGILTKRGVKAVHELKPDDVLPVLKQVSEFARKVG
jgi:hypothetical protein